MIGQNEIRKTNLQNIRTVHTKTKEIYHSSRCNQPATKIAKTHSNVDQFLRAFFKMIGQDEFRKKNLQNIRTVQWKTSVLHDTYWMKKWTKKQTPEKNRAPPCGSAGGAGQIAKCSRLPRGAPAPHFAIWPAPPAFFQKYPSVIVKAAKAALNGEQCLRPTRTQTHQGSHRNTQRATHTGTHTQRRTHKGTDTRTLSQWHNCRDTQAEATGQRRIDIDTYTSNRYNNATPQKHRKMHCHVTPRHTSWAFAHENQIGLNRTLGDDLVTIFARHTSWSPILKIWTCIQHLSVIGQLIGPLVDFITLIGLSYDMTNHDTCYSQVGVLAQAIS